MAPRKSSKNPIDDIGKTVGGWLGGAARSLDTFVNPEKYLDMNLATSRAVTGIQQVTDVLTGGAVSAAKAGPDGFERYARQQIAITAATMGAGAALPSVAGALAKSSAGKFASRKALDLVYEARMLRPVTYRKAVQMKNPLIMQIGEMRGQVARLEDAAETARLTRNAPDYDYMEAYEQGDVYRLSRRVAEIAETQGRAPLTSGRSNRILSETARDAYAAIDPDLNSRERNLANRYLRERGRSVREVLKNKEDFSARQAPQMRNTIEARRAAQRAAKLQRQIDLANAKRNMPENFIDPRDFFR